VFLNDDAGVGGKLKGRWSEKAPPAKSTSKTEVCLLAAAKPSQSESPQARQSQKD
jgi:hypothetical protein